ncbi:MAG: LemA family protein [Clostridia bacterium]|nr:LemA family protein [Clostridia bacterium]
MKKSWIILIAVIAVVGILIGSFVGTYNGLVELEANVEGKQAEIQTQLQRRADLIPNFVATVKGYSDYEQSTLQAVTEARAAVAAADTPEEQAGASAQLDSAIDIWVNAVTEAYPDLKANTQYIALQDELAGTENRIATARRDYNEAVTDYNKSIRKFPRSLLAGMFGFERAELFEADDDAQHVPEVSF